ncbi:chromosome transmission fidelity protein 18 homolog isoform X2 [Lampetra planeri]
MAEWDDFDGFEDEFADELEVLMERDHESNRKKEEPRVARRNVQPTSFEEALQSGDFGAGRPSAASTNPPGSGENHPSKRDAEDMLASAVRAPTTPKRKRPRLDAIKRLEFTADLLPKPAPTEPVASQPGDESSGSHDNDLSGFHDLDASPPDVPAERGGQPKRAVSMASAEAVATAAVAADVERKRVLKRPPLTDDFVNVTVPGGDRYYLALGADSSSHAAPMNPDLSFRSQMSLQLLSVPFAMLKDQVVRERHAKVLEEAERFVTLLNSRVAQEIEDSEELGGEGGGGGDDDGGGDEVDGDDGTKSKGLWVDRFTPRHYTELLSDDYMNRCLLKWLKLWDMVVFGRERKKKPPPVTANEEQPQEQQQQKKQGDSRQQWGQKKKKGEWLPRDEWEKKQGWTRRGGGTNKNWKSKAQITEDILEDELDAHNRPKYKVVLLCGPPGLGKTTLAHVVAHHAGYNVVEMNASDDRSPEVFRTRIEAATQMKSVLGASERPNCLVIDEVDGAPLAAITTLLTLVNRKDTKETGGAAPGGRRRKKDGGLLLRPIICICNDLYTPALRPLRQQAFTLAFPPTMPSRLAQRLLEISSLQGLHVDTGVLLALCEKTENDIRSCINTLQFLQGRGQSELNIHTVQSLSIGLKDQTKGLFPVWQEIFRLPRPQRKRVSRDAAGELFPTAPWEVDVGPTEGRATMSTGAARFHSLLHLVSANGEYEKLTQGLFENYLAARVKDPRMELVCLGTEWLCFQDLASCSIARGQNYVLMRYLPFVAVAFHFLFSTNSPPRLNYPNSNFEMQSKLAQSQNLVTSMIGEASAHIRTHVPALALILDSLCLILDIVSPKMRPVNTQLYSAREKQQLSELVATMLAYNLTYRQERTQDGQYTYLLDPNMEAVARYPSLPQRKQLSYQMRQLIAREVELERMRRTEAAAIARNSTERRDGTGAAGAARAQTAGPKNHQKRLEHSLRSIVVNDKLAPPETDFFGRPVVRREPALAVSVDGVPEPESIERRIGRAVGASDVWFRFNEGFSNAVRRNLHVKDLL